jgi:hypothetical protein
LTLSDQQKEYFYEVLKAGFPDLLPLYQQTYPPGSYSPAGDWHQDVTRRVRTLCERYGIRDRQPRPVILGDKRALNKRVVEALAERVYALELDAAPAWKAWAYRKAAWAIEDLEQDLGLVYRSLGLKGLQGIPDVGEKLAPEVERLLKGYLAQAGGETADDGLLSWGCP